MQVSVATEDSEWVLEIQTLTFHANPLALPHFGVIVY